MKRLFFCLVSMFFLLSAAASAEDMDAATRPLKPSELTCVGLFKLDDEAVIATVMSYLIGYSDGGKKASRFNAQGIEMRSALLIECCSRHPNAPLLELIEGPCMNP